MTDRFKPPAKPFAKPPAKPYAKPATPQLRPAPPRMRRALQGAAAPVEAVGTPEARQLLVEAMRVPEDADSRELTHGFHSYPARFHPLLVRRLLAGSPRGAIILDPFVGSGTTLVEAVCTGARTFGVDINPLAVELSRIKATPQSPLFQTSLLEQAGRIAAASLDRVKKRARTQDSGEKYDDPKYYAPHVFRELVGLREEIAKVSDLATRRTLLLVLSSIIIKVSNQPSETAAGAVERHLAKGFPSRLFQRKTEELARGMSQLAAAVPPNTPRPDLRVGDARAMEHILAASVDCIITSPPYLGTYDYAEHHTRRMGWVGLSPHSATKEIGARGLGRSAPLTEVLAVWQTSVAEFVKEFDRLLKPSGRAYVAIGDSAVGDKLVPGDQELRRATAKTHLVIEASASQERPNFYRPTGRQTRREHLLLLVKK